MPKKKFITALSFLPFLAFIISGCLNFYTNGISVNKDGIVALCLDKGGGYDIAISDSVDSDIFVVDTKGSMAKRITDDEDTDLFVHWSQDGERLLFVSRAKEEIDNKSFWRLNIVDKDGRNKACLIQKDSAIEFPTLSPDGTKAVYYGSNNSTGEKLLYLFDLIKSEESSLFTLADWLAFGFFYWSKDSNRLLALRPKESETSDVFLRGELVVIDIPKKTSLVLFEGLFPPSPFIDWYNDESEIIFTAYGSSLPKETAGEIPPPEVYLFNLETQFIRQAYEFENFVPLPLCSSDRGGFFIPKEEWNNSSLFKVNTFYLLNEPFQRFSVQGWPFWISDREIGFIEEINVDKKIEHIVWVMDKNSGSKVNLNERIKELLSLAE